MSGLLLRIFLPLVIVLAVGGIVVASFQAQESTRFAPSAVNLPQSIRKLAFEERFPYPPLETIFTHDHTWTATLAAERKRVLLVTGDVIPARVVNINTHKYKNFLWPYEKTAVVTSDADITFINLETPLIKNCPFSNEGFTFCGSAENIEGLVFAGVDVASLANNHAGNYGAAAIEETTKYLEDNGILVTGRNAPVYKDIRGVRFAFLGYNDIGGTSDALSKAEDTKIALEIAEAKDNADIVIVQYHWGTEYQDQPDERQKYLGRFTIDAGADLVIGNHPHWVQPVEIYHGKLITYAHGNFVFDQMWSQRTREGVVGRYTFFDKELVDVEYIPVLINDYGQPEIIEDEQYKRSIIDHMFRESTKLIEDTAYQDKL